MRHYVFSPSEALRILNETEDAVIQDQSDVLPQLPSTAPGSAKMLSRVLTAASDDDIADLSIADIEGLFKDLPAYFQFFNEESPFLELANRIISAKGIVVSRRRVF